MFIFLAMAATIWGMRGVVWFWRGVGRVVGGMREVMGLDFGD